MGLTSALQARRGPDELVLVRHGESAGNIADSEARDADAERLELSARDADVELSANGEEQARTLGRWVGGLAEEERPDLVVSSPYRRAADTARAALADLDVELLMDERLRERDLGLLDGLTGKGIRARYPEVPVTTETSGSDTADALVAVSRTAAQLVLDAHARGRYGAGQFGSVRRILIRRAGCPVVVSGSATVAERSMIRTSTCGSSLVSPTTDGTSSTRRPLPASDVWSRLPFSDESAP